MHRVNETGFFPYLPRWFGIFLLWSVSTVLWASEILQGHVALDTLRDVHKEILGVNGELLWSPIRIQTKSFGRIYKKLGFQVLRFPGGTTANYYLWREGAFGCRREPPAESKSSKRIVQFSRALRKKNRTYSIDDLANFARNTGSPVVIVANVLCSSPTDTAYAVKVLRERGVVIAGVEMGNELYYEEPLWAIPTPQDYLRIARRHIKAVRAVDPDVRIGLVVSNTAYKAPAFLDREKLNSRERFRRGLIYDELSSRDAAGDAVILHLYGDPGLSRMEKTLDRVPPDRVYAGAVSHLESRMDVALRYLHDLNPSRDIWITEWGISFYGWMRRHEKDFQKTAYAGLYISRMLLDLLEHDYVTMANVHNMTDFFDRKGGLTSLGHVIKTLAPITRSSCRSARLLFDHPRQRLGEHHLFKGSYPEVVGRAFFADKEGKRISYLVIINNFGTQYRIASLGLNGMVPTGVVKLSPKDGDPRQPLVVGSSRSVLPLKDRFPLNLPPYSITVIDVEQQRTQAGGRE